MDRIKKAICAHSAFHLIVLSLFSFRFSVSFILPKNLCHYQRILKEQSKLQLQTNEFNSPGTLTKSSINSEPVDQIQLKEDLVVYDNCFSSYACKELHYLAIDHSERGDDGSSIFIRPPFNERPLTPIEHAIDSALNDLNDTSENSKLVEYWSREEYMNIDTHSDMDEMQLEEQEIIRTPKIGHVLYLQVKKGLTAPTCVFPKKCGGWDIVDEKKLDQEESEIVDFVTIPTVEGRILRFPGCAMHSVPNPPHRWLLTKKEEKLLREKEEEECEDFDVEDQYVWNDDDDEEEEEEEDEDEDEDDI